MPVPIPQALSQGAGATAAGAAWLARLPQLVQRAQARWGLTLAEPFGLGTTAWTAPGYTGDGTPIVLKVTFPHDEARYEGVALQLWRGLAAVELLAQDWDDWALLLRRAHPGTVLLADPRPDGARIDDGLAVLANLHQAPARGDELPQLVSVCANWARISRDRAFRWQEASTSLGPGLQAGLDLLSYFGTPPAPGTPPEMPPRSVVLHGDLNPGNIIVDAPSSGRHWLAIDPKPLWGDPAYDLWPLLGQIGSPFRRPDAYQIMYERVHRAGQFLSIPPARIAQWALARTIESVLWQWDTFPQPHPQASPEQLVEIQVWYSLAFS